MNYKGGIFPVTECSSAAEFGNHVVQVTGWGTDGNIPTNNKYFPNVPYPTGAAFWYLRNSWGPDWGETGEIRVPMGVNACGMANFMLIPAPDPTGNWVRTQTSPPAK